MSKKPIRISKRGWSPHQAHLTRRKKLDGDLGRLTTSCGLLALSDDDDEEEDFLKQSLEAIGRGEGKGTTGSGRAGSKSPKRGKRPTVSARLPPTDEPATGETEPAAPKKNNTKHCYSSTKPNTSGKTPPAPPRNRSKSPKPPLAGSRSVPKARTPTRSRVSVASRTNANKQNIPMDIQKKLYRITDPDITIKEKVLLELEFMNGTPEEKETYLRYKKQFDRKQFVDCRAKEEEERTEKIEADALREQFIEEEFQKEVDIKRRGEQRRLEKKKAKEEKMLDSIRRYKAESVIKTMEGIKDKALEASNVTVPRNQMITKEREDAERKLIDDFRKNEGKDLHHAELALREAAMLQKDPAEVRALREERSKHRKELKLHTAS